MKMKRLLLLLLAALTLPTDIYAHPNYEGLGIKKQYGFKKVFYGSSCKEVLTQAEQKALKALCKIGLNAGDSGYWSSDDINAAIASIKFGEHWPDYASPTAYKTCNWGGYLD